MGKKGSRSAGKHWFVLEGKPNIRFSGNVKADFTPLRKTKPLAPRSTLPTFQKDHKYFTPSFYIPAEQSKASDDQFLLQYNEKVKASHEISEILVPKPRSKSMYCGVCRSYYEEYIDHITSDQHSKNLKKSIFQNLIGRLCDVFSDQQNDRLKDEHKNFSESSTEEHLGFKCYGSELIDCSKAIDSDKVV